jgi:uncharacterized protein (DUF433 family)
MATTRSTERTEEQEQAGLVLTLRKALHRRIDELTDEKDLLEATRLLDEMQTPQVTPREQALIEQWIEPHPGGPHRARLADSGVPVYAIVGQLGLFQGPIEDQLARVAENYQIPFEVAQAAFAYYRQNRLLIDAWIAMNAV